MSLEEKLEKIRSPKLQSQQSTRIVLSTVEETLRDQKSEITPAAYIAVLLSLLRQAISTTKLNKDLATSLVYLLDVVTPFAPQALLRSKFSQILTNLAPALTYPEADAPLLRPSIGCLESLLISQDTTAWNMGQSQVGPRRALAGLLVLAADHRPKIRKRAQEAISRVLKNPPLSVAVDHPAADMCAESALKQLKDLVSAINQEQKNKNKGNIEGSPSLIHALQLVKTIAAASGGWPVRNIESLCEILLQISKSSNEYMTMAAFQVFEIIFEGMVSAETSSKLPRLLEVISEIRPSQSDTQLLPPWIAIVSRANEVSAQVHPIETFQALPELFILISGFLSSPSFAIRDAASACLIRLMETCIPPSILLQPSIYDEKTIEKLGSAALNLLSIKYQAAWPETFKVISAMFDGLRWKSESILLNAVKIIGEMRENDSFSGKKDADVVIGKAVKAIGPEAVLRVLPLNLIAPKPGQPGRAWILPLLRDHVENTRLQHFITEFIPMSENIYQRILNNGEAEKTMEIKIFETLVQQIWSLLPGYCDLPLDSIESFDQKFAELISNLIYKQVELRPEICRALQNLVVSNQDILAMNTNDDPVLQRRVSKAKAQENLNHLSKFSNNFLAVLFNVYSQTLPQFRGYILQCINTYLSITPPNQVKETFDRVIEMLQTSLTDAEAQKQSEKPKQNSKDTAKSMPPTSHTLMDLVIALSIYLPQDSFSLLFKTAAILIAKDNDVQLQKKAYKLIPRLSTCDIGKKALQDRSSELQKLMIESSEKVTAPVKRDRLSAISTLIKYLPIDLLHFIPEILSEVVISCKETNERARAAAFDLLILMGEKIAEFSGATIENRKVTHMPDDAPSVIASLDEYITMVSAGLAGGSPHMQSACVTALTRILYHFYKNLTQETVSELVETLDLYLSSNNREIVRSVLGFVKVCIISLPTDIILPRLASLLPNLMVWSHEHKGQFKAKVKHIIERMIRRFGIDTVNKYCPIEDRKLISNIRKTKERNKKQKEASKVTNVEDTEKEDEATPKRKVRFESGYDETVYDSDDTSDSDSSDDEVLIGSRKGGKRQSATYIVEDEDDPLDLLDRKSLANISSTKPLKHKVPVKHKVKVDLDGKLLLGETDDAMVLDEPEGDIETGVGAYVNAIKGRNAAQRGRGGRLKFSNKRSKEDEEDMDIDAQEIKAVKDQIVVSSRARPTAQKSRGPSSRSSGRGGIANGRRGLGQEKGRTPSDGRSRGRGGRVMKPSRGTPRRK
ncbi:unnamed protein product [Blumeria hordei]|uniref:Uncharacterized protein n=1 Tax=Blumeria hordei TaxID=2867405 RepID=A0A383UQG3_BLUHO|nr:unnamed protein product [Blumeria hordei]